MSGYAYYKYLDVENGSLFTMIALPNERGRFPTIVCRSPYVKHTVNAAEDELTQELLRAYASFVERGYAIVFQHCKGCGKSTGDFVPYIHEREDGLALRRWIRGRSFYNGELFLMGSSYTSSLHYATAPFEEDIKAAIFEVQDSERYRLWYRNGQMRKGHANWHFGLYKSKSLAEKRLDMSVFSELPLCRLSERVLGERAEDFEEMLSARSPSHEFWHTRYGGQDARDATTHANIPLLLTTGYNDYYVGGVFQMWNEMDAQTKEQSALLVSPYNHGDGYDRDRGICFPCGKRTEQFGAQYKLAWLEHVRTGAPLPFSKGVVTYYRTFEDRWETDFYKTPTRSVTLPLGEGTRSFVYDPRTPTAFSCEGCYANEIDGDRRAVSVYTRPQEKDVFIKGQMQAVLTVSTNVADTSFYVRISIQKEEGAYVLRHDVTSLLYQLTSYRAGDEVQLRFCFDEYAFLLKKGERLRVDITSTDDNTYVSHTNYAGEYALQAESRIATNTVCLDKSYLLLPIEP